MARLAVAVQALERQQRRPRPFLGEADHAFDYDPGTIAELESLFVGHADD